ncbi:hypothetical protein L218DRAFT_999307 [Marasmius fiardii PR-910]|nr:hypothetical protein L218DRAFT_999307 [Marasmius fiardii PR-910]
MSQTHKAGHTADQNALLNNGPGALSVKQVHVVTSPEVDKALWLWLQSMEKKGEQISGSMLMEKCHQFEELFDVPENQRLISEEWIPSFKNTFRIKEYQRHGEAGSVDLAAVAAE